MRIGVNTRLFVDGKMDGIAWFAYEVLYRIVRMHPEHEFVFFFDRKYSDKFIFADNVKPLVVHPQARHPLLWYLFFEIGIKKALKKEKIDVFFSPDGWICLNTNVKTINVIHDLNFEHHPKFVTFSHRLYYRYFFPIFAKKTDTLITVSDFSKKDISQTYHIPEEKIKVVYNAAAEDFFEIPAEEKEQVRNVLTDGKPFFVFVGSGNKRKNIVNQLKAFDLFREKGFDYKLVFAGMQKYWDKEMKHTYKRMKYGKDVIFTGYVSTTELNKIISSSSGLLYASFFEGFGVPILEAFSCNVPVITSKITAMPEISGDAALLVNPSSIQEIADAMCLLSSDQTLSDRLTQLGKNRLHYFSWDKTASQIWNTILEMADKQ